MSPSGVVHICAALALALVGSLACTIEILIEYPELTEDSTSSGSGTGTCDATGIADSSGFIVEPTGPSETDGGEDALGRWYSPCFTPDSDFSTCDQWCSFTELGECAFIVLHLEGKCAPYDDGNNRLGLCSEDIYEVLPSALNDGYRWRCVCDGND